LTDLLALASRVRDKVINAEHDVIVTGATGWLGRVTVELLDEALGPKLPDRLHCFGSRLQQIELRSGRVVESRPIAEMVNLQPRRYVLMHYAYATRDRASVMGLPGFVAANEELSALVLGVIDQVGIEKVFFPSSGAVHQVTGCTEHDLESNPYGVLKLRDERRLAEMADRAGRRVVLCRIFNLAGPFVNKTRHYALSSILEDIIDGGPVRLTSAHPVVRSYAHVRDVVELALAALFADETGVVGPFDTAGVGEIEIGQLAERAAQLLGVPDTPILRPAFRGGEPDRYVGDGHEMECLLRHFELASSTLGTQILDTAAFLGGPRVR